MGIEIDKLENYNVNVVIDNTSMMVKEFSNFDSFIKACEHFGRKVLENFELKDLLDKFEDEICLEWDDEEEIKKELEKIKDYFSSEEN